MPRSPFPRTIDLRAADADNRGMRSRDVLLPLALVLLAFAWADPDLPIGGVGRCRVFVLDFSGSTRGCAAERRARVRAACAGLRSGDSVAWVGFAARAAVGQAPEAWTPEFPGPIESPGDLGEFASRPDLGLELARALPVAGQRLELVLVTDGRGADPAIESTLRRLAATGIDLRVVPLNAGRFLDAAVAAVRGPVRPPAGVPVEVSAELHATAACAGQVSWQVNGQPAGVVAVRFATAGAQIQRLRLPSDGAAVLDVRCTLTVDGESAALEPNNSGGCVITRRGVQRVGVMSRRGPDASVAAWLSGDPTLSLTDPRGEVDLLLLEDLPFASLGAPAVRELERSVRAGTVGLVVTGGRESFSAGGYAGSPLEALLPVSCTPSDALSLVLCLDHSGSMDEPGLPGRTKLEVMINASLAATSLLDAHDRLAVVGFQRLPDVLAPLAPFPGVDAIAERLRGLAARGDTRVLPAVREAQRLLAGAPGRRHILLLSDGQTHETPTEFRELAQRLAAAGVSFSAVAIGGDRVTPEDLAKLQSLSAAGGAAAGRTVRIERDLRELEGLLRDDLKARKGLFHEQQSPVAPTADSAWAREFDRLAPLGGWVRTQVKPEARADLNAVSPSEPVAASWSFGQGRVVAIPTDLAGAWGKAWHSGGDGPAVLRAAVHWALPGRTTDPVQAAAETADGDAVLRVLIDPNAPPETAVGLTATVLMPGAEAAQPIALHAESPRERHARIPVTAPGVYRWTVVRDGRVIAAAAGYAACGREWLRLGADLATLGEWATWGDGRLHSGRADDAPPPPGSSPRARLLLRSALLAAAVALIFLGPLRAWLARRGAGEPTVPSA